MSQGQRMLLILLPTIQPDPYTSYELAAYLNQRNEDRWLHSIHGFEATRNDVR